MFLSMFWVSVCHNVRYLAWKHKVQQLLPNFKNYQAFWKSYQYAKHNNRNLFTTEATFYSHSAHKHSSCNNLPIDFLEHSQFIGSSWEVLLTYIFTFFFTPEEYQNIFLNYIGLHLNCAQFYGQLCLEEYLFLLNSASNELSVCLGRLCYHKSSFAFNTSILLTDSLNKSYLKYRNQIGKTPPLLNGHKYCISKIKISGKQCPSDHSRGRFWENGALFTSPCFMQNDKCHNTNRPNKPAEVNFSLKWFHTTKLLPVFSRMIAEG